MTWLSAPLLPWPGQIETPGLVKRRLLLAAVIMAIAVTGAYEVTQRPPGEPFSRQQLEDMAGLPRPPANFAPTDDGRLRELSPEEYQQLREIRQLIERFPVPDQFVNVRPGEGRGGGEGGG